MLSLLSDSQKAIQETMIMRFPVRESLAYLRMHGFSMSQATYFRQKKKIEKTTMERMQSVANRIQYQHLEKIEKLEFIEKEIWQQYFLEREPAKKVKILESLVSIFPYLSTYYGHTYNILNLNKQDKDKDKDDPRKPMTFDQYLQDNLKYNMEDRNDKDHTEEENKEHYWKLHKEYNEYLADIADKTKRRPLHYDLVYRIGTGHKPPKSESDPAPALDVEETETETEIIESAAPNQITMPAAKEKEEE